MRTAIISKSHPLIVCTSLDHLTAKYKYIGFEDPEGEKYFIVTSGKAKKMAVNPEGTFVSAEEQEEIHTGYVVFNTVEELYDWCLGSYD